MQLWIAENRTRKHNRLRINFIIIIAAADVRNVRFQKDSRPAKIILSRHHTKIRFLWIMWINDQCQSDKYHRFKRQNRITHNTVLCFFIRSMWLRWSKQLTLTWPNIIMSWCCLFWLAQSHRSNKKNRTASCVFVVSLCVSFVYTILKRTTFGFFSLHSWPSSRWIVKQNRHRHTHTQYYSLYFPFDCIRSVFNHSLIHSTT